MIGGMKDVEALGVSPAKSYGHVAGTDARFFGQGLITLPEFDSKYPFQVFVVRNSGGGYSFTRNEGFVDGMKAVGAELKSSRPINPAGQVVLCECTLDGNLTLTKAEVKAGLTTEPFRVVVASGKQTKARIILAQFSQGVNGTYKAVQNVRSNLLLKMMCFEGYAVKGLLPEAENAPQG